MSVNLHLLDTTRPDLTDLVTNLIDLHHANLAGAIRVDYFFHVNGTILGSHLFYVIFREPGSIGYLTAFCCGAGSGNFSHPAQAFKRLMDTLSRYGSPLWSMHPHSDIELYQLFGAVRDHQGLIRPNGAAMSGFYPGQYQNDFLAQNEQLVPAIQTVLGNLQVDAAVHEAFLSIVMANYRFLWESLYSLRPW